MKEQLVTVVGRSAVVTGASRGIGKQIAMRIAASGAQVSALCHAGRNADSLRALASAEYEGRLSVIEAELAEDEAAVEALEQARRHMGSIDILVNNVGDFYSSRIGETDLERFDLAVRLNLRLPVLLTREVLGSMKAQGYGRVINIGSEAGIGVYPGSGAYGITKAALMRLTELTTAENAQHGIIATTIAPADVATPDGESEPYETSLSTDDVANAVMYFLSQDDGVSLPLVRLMRVQARAAQA